MEKPLICGKTAKTYKFWDNLIYHYKHLYPLYGKPVEFKQYISAHDSWLFNFPENLKLHNQVCKFEQALATAGVKKSRFLKKSPKVALSYKDDVSSTLEPRVEKKRKVLENVPLVEKTERPVKTAEKNS